MNYENPIKDSLRLVPRLASFLDRNRYSKTYGCLDRNFWYYKTLTGFPSASCQQGMLVFATLYKKNFKGNIYYQNPQVLQDALASMLFWTKIQNSDGSFNEWYPNEHSHVATAFSSYAASESLLLLEEELGAKEKNILTITLIKSGRWLSRNIDSLVMNHVAGAIAALYNIFIITKNDYFLKAVKKNIDVLLLHQDEEGWFREYHGADIGYLSVSLDYLAKYYRKSNDHIIKQSLMKGLNFLAYFLHPDGSCAGEYGSRGVKYILPHGLMLLSDQFEIARYILSKFIQGLKTDRLVNPFISDDRYFTFFFFPNYIQAISISDDYKFSYQQIQDFQEFEIYFNNSGLFTKKNNHYHFICNLKKNGVFKLYPNREFGAPDTDAGYFIKLKNSKVATSHWLNTSLQPDYKKDDSGEVTFVSRGKFVYLQYPSFNSSIFLLFRTFIWLIGKSSFLMRLFNSNIKKTMFLKRKIAPIDIKRHLIIREDAIEVEDEIIYSGKQEIKDIFLARETTPMYVPSANFSLADYFLSEEQLDNKIQIIESLNKKIPVLILRNLKLKNKSV